MENTKIPTGANTGAAEEKKDYWYFGSVALPLFNGEDGLRTNQKKTNPKKPVTYALFGQLFLAPMMLPHHRKSRSTPEMEENIFRRQRTFLEEYAALLSTIIDIEEQLPVKRAQELVHKLAENGSFQLDTERHRTRNSQSYAVKSSSYAAPERYLSFYHFLDLEGTEELEARIQQVEELYRMELCLIFQNCMGALDAKLRFLLKRLPESGGFVVEGGADAAEETILAGAGRILSYALLWAAAQGVNDWKVYDLLQRRCGMPMLVSTGISGRSTIMSAKIPFSDVLELCSSMCAGGKAVTPREVRSLLKVLERFPRGIVADGLKILYQAVLHARETAYSQLSVEREREVRRKLRGLAGELDQLEEEIEVMLGGTGRESGAP